jgi:hypothetical protein
MYLAPFNYDRFFERVFRHIHIAKAFLEDILDEKIEEIEPLPRKNKLTDDAAFVEFDFRCKIKGKYIIVDMQQWYKNDVVKRFYLYFCNNTSLQLESLKQSNIAIGEGKEYRTKKMEVIELLKTSELSDDDIQYITDYEAHKIGAENYRQSLIEEERYDKKRLLKLKDEEMRLALKRKDEEMKLKDEEMKLKDEEFLNKQLHQIEKCLKRGDSLDIIADFMEIEIETLQSYIDMISKK